MLQRILSVFLIALIGFAGTAEAAKRSATRFSAITVDARSGKVLFAENADAQRYPASLTKMMTLYLVFEDLKAGRIKLSTPLTVSTRAARMPPSKLGLKPGTSITVEQAIKALVIKSANDVAALVGENLGGSESAFADRMTRKASALGMTRTTYRNASGLPNPGQVTTARDQATLSLRLMRDFPQYYPYFRLQGFNFRGKTIRTHNRLVGRFPGTDGLKTGYINASGYNLATSTRRGDKRLVGVVLGSNSAGRRNTYMMNMLTRHFQKATNGRTVAALAGSSQGAVDPLAMAQASAVASTPETPPPESREAMANLAESAIDQTAPAAVDSEEEATEMDPEELAALSKATNGTPVVMDAKLDSQRPEKLPFEVKAGADASANVTEEIGSNNDGDWTIQVGVFRTQRDAEAQINRLKGKIEGLNERQTSTELVRKKLYRAKFLGFGKSEAHAACQRLKAAKADCLPLAPAS